ncbi:MAG: roadblock/LC7 domain-containing protein [Candidatus Hermodarchaeota archaeon]
MSSREPLKGEEEKILEKKEQQIRELKDKMDFLRKENIELQQQLEKLTMIPKSETDLSNKELILNLLKSEALNSKQIAKKLNLSEQDTRTYLLRLKKKDKIKILEKRGRYYVYTYKAPIYTEKPHDFVDFQNEINKKFARLEAKINGISSKELGTQEQSFYEAFEGNLQILEPTRKIDVADVDATLNNLLYTVPNVNAALLVSTEGNLISSAVPYGFDDIRIATMITALLSIAEASVKELKKGEFDQLFIKSSHGYLLVMEAGPNAVLAISTSLDARIGLTFLNAKQTCEKIAKLI